MSLQAPTRRIVAGIALLSLLGCDGTVLNSEKGLAPVEPPPELDACDVAFDPGPTLVRRIAPWEFAQIVESGLGVDPRAVLEERWPPTARLQGLTVMSEAQGVTLTHVEAFADIAEAVAEDVPDSRRLEACGDTMAPDCPSAVAADLGALLFRRPLTDAEVARFAAPMETALMEGFSPEDGASWILQALLQAGPFLYRIEEEPDRTAPVDAEALASRLSFLVWGEGPDEPLLRAAQRGELANEEGIRQAVQRLFDDPRAVAHSSNFVVDWLGLASVRNSDIAAAYPEVDDALLEAMKDETLALARQIMWEENAPLTDLLTRRETIVTGRLAEFYGLEPQGNAAATYPLSDGRAGLLTQGAILAQAGGAGESMIARGLFVLEDILCTELARPDGIDTSDDGSMGTNTEREASEVRLGRSTCAGCHGQMEPLAHPFEPFDGAGRIRNENSEGFALRSDGEVRLANGETLAWSTPEEFVDQIADTDAVGLCLVERPLAFALGRPLEEEGSDPCVVEEIRTEYLEQGGTYRALVEAIAAHPIFRFQRAREE
ncbi:MAG: DUF1592 domain-containing protein [Myxococcota bacterium]